MWSWVGRQWCVLLGVVVTPRNGFKETPSRGLVVMAGLSTPSFKVGH